MHTFWDKYLYFLILTVLFVFVFTCWMVYGAPEVRDLARDLAIALIALASGRRLQSDTNITTDTVETPAVNTNTIDNSTVNAESLNVENKKENTE